MAGKVFKQDEDARRRVMGGRIESGKPEAGRSFYCRIELDEGSKYSKDVMDDIRRQLELNLNPPSNAKDSGGVFGESDWKSNAITTGGETHYDLFSGVSLLPAMVVSDFSASRSLRAFFIASLINMEFFSSACLLASAYSETVFLNLLTCKGT